jgi:hypothetical protein
MCSVERTKRIRSEYKFVCWIAQTILFSIKNKFSSFTIYGTLQVRSFKRRKRQKKLQREIKSFPRRSKLKVTCQFLLKAN